ncbi:MAG: hypothetical protein K6G36_00400 [Candidatus Saccharibacteria bacterium]|nr:hypothetical protein [Candidatus Saccharibacteria bacterium]
MEDYTVKTDHTVNDWATLVPDDLGQSSWDEVAPKEDETPKDAPEEEPDDQEEQLSEPERLLKRANLYRKFGKVALALAAIDEAKDESVDAAEFLQSGVDQEGEEGVEKEKSPEELQASALMNQLKKALDDVDLSLEKQLEYNIVYHKQINTKEALEEELQKGTAIPELDIRFDKDGTPWISHSPRAGGRFWFSKGHKSTKPIHELTTEEVKEIGGRLSLEDGLAMLAEYAKDNPNHFPVLELKELGPSAETSRPYLEKVKELLEKNGFADKAIFATLSPSILRATHDVFPDNPKILNGGIAPVISYNLAENTNKEESGKEVGVKIPGVELYFSNATEFTERPDGYGKQTGYLWTRLPKETVETLRESKEKTGVGAASLTVVNKFADVLQIFSPRAAKKVREHYRKEVEKLGLNIQAQISKKNMHESASRILEQFGDDTILYTNASEDWSEFDPKKKDDKEKVA